MKKYTICIISFSRLHRDARVLRQIKYLMSHYNITVIGFDPPSQKQFSSDSVNWIAVDDTPSSIQQKAKRLMLLVLGRFWPSLYERWYWGKLPFRQAFDAVVASGCNVIHANDLDALPVAVESAYNIKAKVVLDLHEYLANIPYWGFYKPAIDYFLEKYASELDASITVASFIAQRYSQEYDLKPIVIMNTPEYRDIPPRNRGGHGIHLIHHGGATPKRRLETMIETVALCDQRYHLHFMLVENNLDYIRFLKEMSEQLAEGRVTFHKPVPPDEIVLRIADYDIGFCYVEPSSYSYEMSLPNKFFDSIMAGLAVCIGPSPSMMEIVNQYGCGCIASSFRPEDLADALNRLDTEEINTMRKASRKAALELNAENEMGKLVRLYQQLLA